MTENIGSKCKRDVSNLEMQSMWCYVMLVYTSNTVRRMNHDVSSEDSGRESDCLFFIKSDRTKWWLFQNPRQLRPAMESSRESLIVILKSVWWSCNHAIIQILTPRRQCAKQGV